MATKKTTSKQSKGLQKATTGKNASAKKTTAKKTTTTRGRKPATAKAQSSKQSAGLQGGIKLLSATGKAPSTRRPPNNPDMPTDTIESTNMLLNDIKAKLDDYAQHLRSLDRMRLNGVGSKKLGFIERAYAIALENAEFLPHYLTIQRFGKDIEYFMDFRTLVDLTSQIREKLWNITIQSADIAYTDALEFYASVREASKRRVDAAETIHKELATFFDRSRPATEDEPTEAKAKRDFNSLIHGKHDGKLVIENISPKLTRGKRKLIDETFRDTVQFKDIVEGEIED